MNDLISEIEKEAKERYDNDLSTLAESTHGYSAFIEGAKWLLEKLNKKEHEGK